MHDWFVPWIEGYTGFDEVGRPCELPLSWYFVRDNENVLQLEGECPNKIRDLSTFCECTICESSSPFGLPPESNEAFIGANPSSILSRISGGLVCDISTRIRSLSEASIINYNAFEIVVSLCFAPLISDEAKAEDLKDQSLKDVVALEQSSH